MLKTYEREKLLNAIIYFASNTANCGKTKLFKLLFLLDFDHYKQTGRSVTGLDYYAWRLGPVPADLDDELDGESVEDKSLWESIEVKSEWVISFTRLKILPKREFQPDHFSKRELRLLESIAKEHGNKTAEQLVELTHVEDGVWSRVWANGAGKFEKIPYELSLEGEGAAHILSCATEYKELKEHFAG